jgi:hypothetical protein
VPALPFDSVSIKRDGRHVTMSAKEFLDIPMAERVTIILERSVQFYAQGQLVERSLALKQWRTLSVPDR